MKSYAALVALVAAVIGQASGRRLMQHPADEGGWTDGRATWFEHPWTGSCGYGKLDGYQFGYDAVAAMPDVFRDFNTSCGRCYEVKCRGIQAISAGGSVNLDRHDACYDTSKSIVIKIVDTCPCHGNEKWCCGDMDHFDLGASAFARLAPQGKGIIGLKYRAVPCSQVNPGGASQSDWNQLQEDVAMGADPNVFMEGEIGLGWKKTVYLDKARSMYTYNPSVVAFSSESVAVCGEFEQYGGFDFHTQADRVSVFEGAKGVEFWVQSQAGLPNVEFKLGNIKGGICWNQLKVADYAKGDTMAGWTKAFFPLEDFDCTHDVQPKDVNRVQWEARDPSGASICVKDVKIIRDDSAAAPSARAIAAAAPSPEPPSFSDGASSNSTNATAGAQP